jgi:tetratricopeptide (TPR) repeat protein
MGEGLVRLQRGIALSGEKTLLPEALEDFDVAAGVFEEIGAHPLHARALHAYGQALEAAGDSQAARSRIEQAAALFDELGIKPDQG